MPGRTFAFYLSGLLHTSDTVRRALAVGPVIADRYASSVMACHAAVNRVRLDQVRELITPFWSYLVAPDVTFYLVSSATSLRKRMFDVPGRLDKLQENFAAVAETDPSAVLLTTDGRSPDELADAVITYLEDRRAPTDRH
ncbi:hypothetical protein ACWGOK_23300 [Streptomyces eurythermus]